MERVNVQAGCISSTSEARTGNVSDRSEIVTVKSMDDSFLTSSTTVPASRMRESGEMERGQHLTAERSVRVIMAGVGECSGTLEKTADAFRHAAVNGETAIHANGATWIERHCERE